MSACPNCDDPSQHGITWCVQVLRADRERLLAQVEGAHRSLVTLRQKNESLIEAVGQMKRSIQNMSDFVLSTVEGRT